MPCIVARRSAHCFQASQLLSKGESPYSSLILPLLITSRWRWSMWELLWLSSFVLVLLIIFLPETSTPTLLYHRSKLLRDETGSDNYVDERSIALRGVSTKEAVKAALIKPFEISLKDPSIAFVNIYVSYFHGIVNHPFQRSPCLISLYRHRSLMESTIPSLKFFHLFIPKFME